MVPSFTKTGLRLEQNDNDEKDFLGPPFFLKVRSELTYISAFQSFFAAPKKLARILEQAGTLRQADKVDSCGADLRPQHK
jgi:hypothetical protein